MFFFQNLTAELLYFWITWRLLFSEIGWFNFSENCRFSFFWNLPKQNYCLHWIVADIIDSSYFVLLIGIFYQEIAIISVGFYTHTFFCQWCVRKYAIIRRIFNTFLKAIRKIYLLYSIILPNFLEVLINNRLTLRTVFVKGCTCRYLY